MPIARVTKDQKILDPDIFIDQLPVDPFTKDIWTNNFIQQGLNRLLGYNPDEKKWARIRVDSAGKLHIRDITIGGREAEDVTLFDTVSLVDDGLLTHEGIDVSTYAGKTILLSTTGTCTLYVQFSNDNTNWYDWCDAAGTAMSFTVNNVKKAIGVDDHCHYIRLIVHNTSGSTVVVECVLSMVV